MQTNLRLLLIMLVFEVGATLAAEEVRSPTDSKRPWMLVTADRVDGLRSLEDVRRDIRSGRSAGLWEELVARVDQEMRKPPIAAGRRNRNYTLVALTGNRIMDTALVALISNERRYAVSVLEQIEVLFDKEKWPDWSDEAHLQAGLNSDLRHGQLARAIGLKEYVVMRSVPSPRPNLQGVMLDRTGVFEEVGVVPVVDTILTANYLDATTTTLTVESTDGFPDSGSLLIAGNHSMAAPEIVTYAGKTETAFLDCQRGAEPSQPAMHWSGARVGSLSAMKFIDTQIPDPKRQYYNTVRAREHSGLTSPYSRISNAVVERADQHD